jgi:transcriptional regulator GlxA family with amidase domain
MANCLEPFRAANTLGAKEAYQWKFVSLDGKPVQSSSDLRLMPDQVFGETKRADFLFVIASYDFRMHDTVASRRALRAATKRYQTIIGLDCGPWLMAGAGLLDEHKATAHWDIIDEFAEEFVDVDVIRKRFIFDEPIVTCSGAMAAFDLSLELIRKLSGPTIALDVAAIFMSGTDTPEHFSQRTICKLPIVQAAVDIMAQNIEDILTIPEIARHCQVAPKQLLRLFAKDLNQSPQRVYRNIRLSFARHLLQTTQMPVREVVLRTGYQNVSAFSRAFRARFDLTPSDYRAEFQATENPSA